MRPYWLFTGRVGHARLQPVTHRFTYPALFLCFPLHEQHRLSSRLFSLNRWNLFAYYDRDHGPRDGSCGLTWFRTLLASRGLAAAGHTVWLQTQPRVLGFVFNPVSFWYGHDEMGALRVVLCEVNNTFGERHSYLLRAEEGGPIHADSRLDCEKIFHVSPFFPVEGHYQFRFLGDQQHRQVHIDYYHGDTAVLRTHVQGKAHPLSDRQLLRAFLEFGWSTALVVWRIHWQALKLWRKGVRFHKKPQPPVLEISP